MEDNLNDVSKSMRQRALILTNKLGNLGAHIGGTLSLIEIMATLYLKVVNIDRDSLYDENRDRIILSKGHGALAQYLALWKKGIIEESELETFKRDETRLTAHPARNASIGIEFSSGSLGQGVSLGVGVCLALKRKNLKSNVYVVLGDGECDEGSVWEAAQSASHYKLDNLTVIVDKNKLQYDGATEDVLSLKNLQEKWKSFGFKTLRADGHNEEALYKALTAEHEGQPLAVIADTIKGKGVSFMENNPLWHNGRLTDEQLKTALSEVANGKR